MSEINLTTNKLCHFPARGLTHRFQGTISAINKTNSTPSERRKL